MKARIDVKYTTKNTDDIYPMDSTILLDMDSIGAEFIADGYNLNTGVRDMQFELDIEVKRKPLKAGKGKPPMESING